MREIVHMQIGQCGNQIGAKVRFILISIRKIASIDTVNFRGKEPTINY